MFDLRLLNIACNILSAVLMLIPAVAIFANHKSDRLNKCFLLTFVLGVLFLLCDTVAWWNAENIAVSPALSFAAHALGALAFMSGALYIIVFLFGDKKTAGTEGAGEAPTSRWSSHGWWMLTAVFLLMFLAQWLFASKHTEYNGAYRAHNLLVPVAFALIGLRAIWIGKERTSRQNRAVLRAVALVPLLSALAKLVFPDLPVNGFCMVAMLLMMYVSMQGVQSESLYEKELALSKGNAELVLSQIQQHFVYNTLVAISQLCDIDPALASEATEKFSQYMRVNIESLRRYEPVPFEEELEHVRIYLYIEKMRFAEKLNVEYDIRATNFMLPVLSLQPIVENAVRHGITKKEGHGKLIIRTEETEASWVITVEDDGVGFDEAALSGDGKVHMGIENVRSRLAAVCSGELKIESTLESGTVASIIIPKGVVGR